MAEMRDIGGVAYVNDGDWVESCTALVEDLQGHIAIIDWIAETGGHTAEGIPAHQAEAVQAEPAE
jgi:hypothetical protein